MFNILKLCRYKYLCCVEVFNTLVMYELWHPSMYVTGDRGALIIA